MPRQKNAIQKERITLWVDPTIAGLIELISYTPVSERSAYGVKGSLIETAVRQYFTNHQTLKRGRAMSVEEQNAVNKAEAEADAKEAAGEYPDPDTMDPKEREQLLMVQRRRVLAGEQLPSAEIRHCLLMLRAGRNERQGRIPGGGNRRAAKPQVEAFNLSDFE